MKTAAELIAPIQSIIVAPKAGERFINPRLSDGFLDDATGGGWVLLQRSACTLTEEAERILQTLGAEHFDIESLDDPEGHLSAWFSSRGATAALVRPDFYLAAAGSGPEVSRSIATMAKAMGLAPAP